ncbi:metal ABC transporter permease [Desulfofundulus thermobenzoicus]|nr:metal ABC transporter permease [Desulfofundulus thermobenzoicus]
MDLSILSYQFMQNAILAGLLGGVACSLIGVFVVTMNLSFIGVAISHAAFAGALCGTWLGFNPLAGAFLFSLVAAAVIGPLADRGEFNPDTPIGIIFSVTMGMAFLFMGLLPGPKTQALELLWGSILTVNDRDLLLLAVVAAVVVSLVVLFFKEIQAVIFHREVALAVGIPASLIFYGLLFLTGVVITVSLRSIGGLLIFNLILNPAAAAYQLTYNLRLMFILSSLFGVLSTWTGLFLSAMFDLPSGATIVIVSGVIFVIAASFSPKRKVKKWEDEVSTGPGKALFK